MPADERNLPSEALLAVAILFAPLAFGTTESWSRAVLAGLLSLAYLAYIFRVGLRGAVPASPPPLLYGAVILLLLAFVQALSPVSLASIGPPPAFFTFSRARTLEWIFDNALYISCLLFLPGIYGTKGSQERLSWLLLIGGALVALIGIAQQQASNEYYYGFRKVSHFRAPFGPYPNKNHAGGFLAMCALAGMGLVGQMFAPGEARPNHERKDEFFGRLAILLSLEFVVFLGLFRANSRGAVIACIASGTCLVFLQLFTSRRYSRTTTFSLTLASLALIAITAHFAGVRWGSYLPGIGENSLTFRQAMVADALKIIEFSPWTGIGLGALKAGYPLWMDPVMKGFFTDHLHCDPLELAAEAGIPSAVIYYSSFMATIALLASPRRGIVSLSLRLGLTAAAGSFLIHQTVDFPAHITSLHFIALLCLAAAWAGDLTPDSTQTRHAPLAPFRRAIVGTAFVVFASFSLAPRLLAAYYDLLASQYLQPSKLYFQAQALSWEPTFERNLQLARSYWQIAEENPAARGISLRTALRHSDAALRLEPLHPEARRVHNILLSHLASMQAPSGISN